MTRNKNAKKSDEGCFSSAYLQTEIKDAFWEGADNVGPFKMIDKKNSFIVFSTLIVQ